MSGALSVVVPTLNAERDLPGLLTSLDEGGRAGLVGEVIVSDGGSRDATCAIAGAAGAVIVTGAASRGGQLRRGAAVARGTWLLVLHADTGLPGGWAAVVSAQIARGRPGYFRLSFDAPGVAPALVAAWANLRARVFHLPYGDQGLLISTAEYDAVGGYPDIALMEDVALARRLGRRLQAMPLTVRTSVARYRRDGWLRRGVRNLWLLLRYLAGADPEVLRRRY